MLGAQWVGSPVHCEVMYCRGYAIVKRPVCCGFNGSSIASSVTEPRRELWTVMWKNEEAGLKMGSLQHCAMTQYIVTPTYQWLLSRAGIVVV